MRRERRNVSEEKISKIKDRIKDRIKNKNLGEQIIKNKIKDKIEDKNLILVSNSISVKRIPLECDFEEYLKEHHGGSIYRDATGEIYYTRDMCDVGDGNGRVILKSNNSLRSSVEMKLLGYKVVEVKINDPILPCSQHPITKKAQEIVDLFYSLLE